MHFKNKTREKNIKHKTETKKIKNNQNNIITCTFYEIIRIMFLLKSHTTQIGKEIKIKTK